MKLNRPRGLQGPRCITRQEEFKTLALKISIAKIVKKKPSRGLEKEASPVKCHQRRFLWKSISWKRSLCKPLWFQTASPALVRKLRMSDDHQDTLQSPLASSDEEKWCIYRSGWVVLFSKDHFLGAHSLWDCILLQHFLTDHIFRSSPKKPRPRLTLHTFFRHTSK